MSNTSLPEETSRTALIRRSNKNYDELIRDYIRGARERLEAARQRSPPATVKQLPNLPRSDSIASSLQPQHTRSLSSAIAKPSPSAHWPLFSAPQPHAPHTETASSTSQDSTKAQNPHTTSSETISAVNLNDRPIKVLATAAPQLGPSSTTSTPLQSQHRRGPSSLSHPGTPSIPTIREGHPSHVRTPSKSFALSLPPEEQRQNNSQDDNELNPFRDGGLVREASVGRSHRPVLTEIVSRGSQEQRRSADQTRGSARQIIPPTPELPLEHARIGLAVVDTSNPALVKSTPASYGPAFRSGTVLPIPAASVISQAKNDIHEESNPAAAHELESVYRPATAESCQSSGASFRLGNLSVPNGKTSLGDRVGSRKPAPLNLGAVKEAEKRGSLTSLPDLIHRALRLASNLEQGKNTSQLGGGSTGNKTPAKSTSKHRRGVSQTMAASFVSSSNPESQTVERTRENWPRSAGLQSTLRRSFMPSLSGSGHDPEKARSLRRRRCCGMPLWLFALIIALVFVLIVAAILVPIFVIVVPQEAKSSETCAHGGVSITTPTGTHQCICVDGYTGTSCTRADQSGCTSVTLSNVENATVGTMVQAVLADAATDYSINLNVSVLLPLFSALDMTCESEISLIQFEGLTSRSLSYVKPQFIDRHKPTHTFTAAVGLITAAPEPVFLRPRLPQTMTENGIVFAQSTSSSTTISTPTSTTAASSASTSTSSSTFDPTSDFTLGFARTAVLYILQSGQQLVEAQSAHSRLYLFFAEPTAGDPTSLDLDGGWTVNLEKATITDGDGVTVGG